MKTFAAFAMIACLPVFAMASTTSLPDKARTTEHPVKGMHTLELADNEIHTLDPGSYTFDRIVMGKNATIMLTGTTRLTAREMVTQPGARIQYEKHSARKDSSKFLELIVLNGSKMTGAFSIVGSGGDGRRGPSGSNGANGNDEHTKVRTKMIKIGFIKTKVPDGIQHIHPTNGANGGHGQNGEDGEEAMDLDISMHNIDPSCQCVVVSNGGNGGNAGHGGNGGNGGRGKRFEKGGSGGNGGNGGDGGSGGDAGNIDVRLIYKQNTSKKRLAELNEFLRRNMHAMKGVGGVPGRAGTGGTGGDGREGGRIQVGDLGIKRSAGNGGSSGTNGAQGGFGDDGRTTEELVDALEFGKMKRHAIERLLN